ncbi:MAG: FUSC family membrane protein [Steroidobacteraceae bacterium]
MIVRLARRLPAYLLNGIAVAVGVGLIRLLIGEVAGALPAQLAVSGALCAALADAPNTRRRTLSRVFVAAVLSFSTALVVAALKSHPAGLGIAIAVVGFAGTLSFAWGQRATPIAFAPILALVFSMAVPRESAAPLAMAAWNGVGGLIYLLWSALSCWLLQRRYRSLALADALSAVAGLFRARAELLHSRHVDLADTVAMQAWIRGEAELAERLQVARDFIYVAPDTTAQQRTLYQRNCGILLRSFDLRDLLLASRLDLDLLGDDADGRWLLGRVAEGLRRIGIALDDGAERLIAGGAPGDGGQAPGVEDLFEATPLAADDPRLRLVPALLHRLGDMCSDVRRIQMQLAGRSEAMEFTRPELQRFVVAESWPLGDLIAQLRWHSSVLRHALRTALALGSAYFVALILPWASHPHWLVLSVAVVLRGNLEQTLSRRNMRVLGTLLGCLVVVVLGRLNEAVALSSAFLLAIAISHAFAPRRYWIAASAATVMALIQAHLVNPTAGFPIAERVADTLLGALLAWGFSYVLPSWERRRMPQAIQGVLRQLEAYTRYALVLHTDRDGVEQRLARRRSYDALSNLATLMQRSVVEPRAVRVPVTQLAALLDHGQRLMAHLSMVRMTLSRRGAALQAVQITPLLARTREAVLALLDLRSGTSSPPPPGVPELDLKRLPRESPSEDISPWLMRRLERLEQEAALIRTAAQSVLPAAQAALVKKPHPR